MRSKNDWLDYLEHSALCHYGVIGMHWGIRRYQPYSTVPRKSGGGGKEIGAAKKSQSSIGQSNRSIKNAKLQKAKNKGVYELAFLEAIQNKGLNDAESLKEYSKYLDDRHKYMSSDVHKLPDDEGIGIDKVPSIKYKTDKDGDEVGSVKFGNCDDCMCIIKPSDDFWDEPGGNKRDIDKIVSDSKFEKQMRSNAADGLYKHRTDNISNESKEQYKKKLRCEQMTATEPDRVHVWYTHPDDFGDWYMVIDTKNKKILSGEGFS